MSSTNRVTLAQLDKMTAEDVRDIPQDQLVMLIEDLTDAQSKMKAREAKVKAEVSRRYTDKINVVRSKLAKPTGTVNFDDGEFAVKADAPKKVTWDQKKLGGIFKMIDTEWSDNVLDFIDVEYSVSEKKYTAWPSSIRDVFEPARTLATGTQTFKFERREAA